MKRLIIHIILVFLFWNNTLAQSEQSTISLIVDSSQLDEKLLLETFVVTEKRQNSISHYINQSYDFNRLIQMKLPIQVKSYGSWGSVSTLSIRGTSDDQNGILWNGIPIHSPTLGSTDLSLIPLEVVDKINLALNYDANLLNSSSFGGLFSLETNENIFNSLKDSNFIFKINAGYGSNVLLNHSANFIFQNEKLKTKTTAFYQFAQNDFKYTDVFKENGPRVKATHNKMMNRGFMQDLNLTIPKGDIKMSVWFQEKTKEIPAIMGSYDESSKNQKDQVIRISNVYKLNIKKNELVLTGAFLKDNLFYTDKINPLDSLFYIDSKIKTKQFFQSSFLTVNSKIENFKMVFGQIFNFQKADVSSYSVIPVEFTGAISTSFDYKYKFLNVLFGIKQEFRNSIQRPNFSGALQANTKGNNPFNFRFSVAEKFRQPDLNDKYWAPGGNINLQPERGQTIDFIISKYFQHNNSNFFLKANPYLILIKENIVWIPIAGIFSPQNISKTQHSGIDITGTFNNRWKKLLNEINIIYSYNHSIIKENRVDPSSNGKFLPYKPIHTYKLNFLGNWKWLDWSISNQIFSQRFTDNSNNKIFALPTYYQLDINIGGKWLFKSHVFGANFSILNATNTQFQSIRSYAQPGTQILFALIYSIQKSLKQNKNEKK
jgi:iron complex outermembrane receptor protein